jgi:hypothetical protein
VKQSPRVAINKFKVHQKLNSSINEFINRDIAILAQKHFIKIIPSLNQNFIKGRRSMSTN